MPPLLRRQRHAAPVSNQNRGEDDGVRGRGRVLAGTSVNRARAAKGQGPDALVAGPVESATGPCRFSGRGLWLASGEAVESVLGDDFQQLTDAVVGPIAGDVGLAEHADQVVAVDDR
ncbi:hypothetical protein GCM10009670_30390 [Citricoccus alkalitolerans]